MGKTNCFTNPSKIKEICPFHVKYLEKGLKIEFD
jgi:hypothetical protein